MRTVRRLFYRDIGASVGFVAVAFLSLFFFIDFVDDLDQIGRQGRAPWHVALTVLYAVPGHLYDLLPIAVLIGSIYALARMAQASEYTILRTGGLGPGRALKLLALIGLAFGALNFVVGDFITPAAEQASLQLAARFDGERRIAGAGAWLKGHRLTPEGARSVSINVARISRDGLLQDVRVFEFDNSGRLLARASARGARVDRHGRWQLHDVQVTSWPAAEDGAASAAGVHAARHITDTHLPEVEFDSDLDAAVVAAAVLPLTSMTTIELWRYSRHLDEQAQASQQVAIRFWKKALYPLSCLVMVALALPFAYLHARTAGVSLKVFGGIMLGIGFVLLNNLAGHLGMLRGWTPWVVAAAPSLLFLLLSLAAFAWLVRYR
ncbi:MAG: LPS export ABC transporter permease LptG [Rubrivivax sp. SCN 71-131]|nr:MAG: LPS export ABC transporter permease LptG [Rubrivivax sp. SCN 71-131]